MIRISITQRRVCGRERERESKKFPRENLLLFQNLFLTKIFLHVFVYKSVYVFFLII